MAARADADAAPAPQRRRRFAVDVALLAGLVVVVGAALWWSNGAGWLPTDAVSVDVTEARSLVAKDAQAVAISAPLGALADQLAGLAGHFEGSGALAEAVGALVGLDRFDRASLTAAGVDAGGRALAFVDGDALWVGFTGVGAAALLRMLAHLRQQGVVVVPEAGPPQRWRLGRAGATLRHLAPDVALARLPLPASLRAQIGAVERGADADVDAVAVAAEATSTAAVDAAWTAWQQGPKLSPGDGAAGSRGEDSDIAGDDVALRVDVALGAGDRLRPALRAKMGVGALLFGRVADQIASLRLELRALDTAPTLAVRARLPQKVAAELAAYHQGFLPAERALALGDVLPDELALWGRLRLNPALLGMLPDFLRARVLPADLLGRVDAALATVDARTLLIDAWDGQLAAGVLGVDDGVQLDPAALQRDPSRALGAALGHASSFIVVGLRDDAARDRLLDAIAAAMRGAGREVTALDEGVLHGAIVGGGAPLAFFRVGAGLLVLRGAGEVERWLRVGRGRLPTLAATAGSDLERDIAAGREHWLALGSTTGRIVRAARRRGIPEHFVRMLASVAALSLRVGLDDAGVELVVQLRPRTEEAP